MTPDRGVLETRRYPVAAPDITEVEVDFSSDAVRSTWISSQGPYLEKFEAEFAAACQVGNAIAVSNGTVALHLVLVGLGIGPGDEVIVPSLTYIASVNAIQYVGATPVFADVDPSSWCLDPDHVAALLGPRTAAIIAVHLYGNPADMSKLRALSLDNGVALIEDAAEAPFATLHDQPTGGLGHVGTFSFFGNKILSCGEGGAVTTNDDGLARRLRQLRGQGMDPERRYYFPIVGYNYRLTNVAAALLCAQMSRRDEMLGRRATLFEEYDREFFGERGLDLQPTVPDAVRAPWLYTLLARDEAPLTRDAIMRSMANAEVETRPMFIPVHTLPPYLQLKTGPLPVTDDISARGFSLPTSSTYSSEDAREIARRLKTILTHA